MKATGAGLQSANVGDVCKFVVDTKCAGSGGLTLAIEGPSETSLKYMDDKNGSCFVEYVPTEPGEYEISIIFGQAHIPGSPFKVTVNESIDPSLVRVFGPAIDGSYPVKVGIPTHFIVDVALAGPGLVGVTLNNIHGIAVENVKVENNSDGLYSVHFVPPVEGLLMAYVKFAHQDVPSRYYYYHNALWLYMMYINLLLYYIYIYFFLAFECLFMQMLLLSPLLLLFIYIFVLFIAFFVI